MLIGNFRMISLRSEVLCRLQRLLHLLRVFVDAHLRKTSEHARKSNRPSRMPPKSVVA
jgi:hypothetical protein